MTTTNTLSSVTLSPLPPPRLRRARFDDYPQIADLAISNGWVALPAQDWRGLWLDNPLWDRLGNDWPIGWVLEDAAGRLVGSLGNLPSLYTFRGRRLVAAAGRGWTVRPEYRGMAPLLMDEYFNQEGADLLINTTVNAPAEGLNSALSARVPLGDWQAAAFWVTGYRGFARTALRIKGVPLAGLLAAPAAAALRLREAFSDSSLPAGPAWVTIAEASDFDSRFDAFWEELVRQNPNKLLGVRDSRSLGWHFAIPMRAGQVWIMTASRNGVLRAYCILKRSDQPQGHQGLIRMRLVDYQTLEPDEDLLPGLLKAALKRCAAEGIYVLEHLGCGLPKMHSFDRFAPYRRRLPCWKYYYKGADPALDAELARPEVWDPSAFDGDASIA